MIFQWFIHSHGSLIVAFPGSRYPLDVPHGRSDHLGSHTRARNYIPPLARPRSGWLCSAVRSAVACKSERGVASFGGRTVKFGFRVGCRVSAISHPLKCRVSAISPFGRGWGYVRRVEVWEVWFHVYGPIWPLRGPQRRLWMVVGKVVARKASNRFWGALGGLQAISVFYR